MFLDNPVAYPSLKLDSTELSFPPFMQPLQSFDRRIINAFKTLYQPDMKEKKEILLMKEKDCDRYQQKSQAN